MNTIKNKSKHFSLSQIGIGSKWIGGCELDEGRYELMMREMVGNGRNVIDCSPTFAEGRNLPVLGKFLKKWMVEEQKMTRSDLVVVSKIGTAFTADIADYISPKPRAFLSPTDRAFIDCKSFNWLRASRADVPYGGLFSPKDRKSVV